MIPRVHKYCDVCQEQKGIARDDRIAPGMCAKCEGQLRLVYDRVSTGQWFWFMVALGFVLQSPIISALEVFAYAPNIWVAWYNLVGSILSLVFVLIGLLWLFIQYRANFNKINWNLASDERPLDYNSQFMKAIIYSAIVGVIIAFLMEGIITLIALGITEIIPPP